MTTCLGIVCLILSALLHWFIAKRFWWALVYGQLVQAAWLVYAMLLDQVPLAFLGLWMAGVYAFGGRGWRRE